MVQLQITMVQIGMHDDLLDAQWQVIALFVQSTKYN